MSDTLSVCAALGGSSWSIHSLEGEGKDLRLSDGCVILFIVSLYAYMHAAAPTLLLVRRSDMRLAVFLKAPPDYADRNGANISFPLPVKPARNLETSHA